MNYNKIDEIREKKKMPKMEFYRRLGMSDSGYRRSIERKSLGVETLEKIAEVLEVSAAVFFEPDEIDGVKPFDVNELPNILALKIPPEEKIKLLADIVKLLCVSVDAQKTTIARYEVEIQKLKQR